MLASMWLFIYSAGKYLKSKCSEMSENRDWQRLQFRSWHRGTREMDLLLGTFADHSLPDFSALQLAQYEQILQHNDPDLYNWLSGREAVPAEHDSEVMGLLLHHRYASTQG